MSAVMVAKGSVQALPFGVTNPRSSSILTASISSLSPFGNPGEIGNWGQEIGVRHAIVQFDDKIDSWLENHEYIIRQHGIM